MNAQEEFLTLHELSRGTGIPYYRLLQYITFHRGLVSWIERGGIRLFPRSVLEEFNRLRVGNPPSNLRGYLDIDEVSRRSGIPLLSLKEMIRDDISSSLPVLDRNRQRWFPEDIVSSLKWRVDREYLIPERPSVHLELVDPMLLKAIEQHPTLLKSLGWRTFEEVLAEVLHRLGYEIELRRGTKDGGIDIFALKREDAFGLHRYLIQAKRWSKSVGVAPVREIMFLHNQHRITKSCLATTSSFTKGAWKLGSEFQWQLELRDLQRLQEWVKKALEGNPGSNV